MDINSDLINVVKKELYCPAHDIEHINRVIGMCYVLSSYEENINMNVLIPAAILHDIARKQEDDDSTGMIDHAELGAEISGKLLKKMKCSGILIGEIMHCIYTHRFRTRMAPKTIEAKILFDADKLDSIGAVGTARMFMLASRHHRKIYDNFNYQQNNNCFSPNIEYEYKAKKIADRLFTHKAKELATERITLMDNYFFSLQTEIALADPNIFTRFYKDDEKVS